MSGQIYPPEGHIPPLWGVTVLEFEKAGKVMLQLNAGTVGTVGEVAALVNELQAMMTALTLSGKAWGESQVSRSALIYLMGGTPPEGL